MKRILSVLVFMAFVFSFAYCAWGAFGEKQIMAPDFELQDTRQEIVRLSDYKDKQAVLLFFWTTLCPLCEEELRIIDIGYAALLNDGVEVLAIDVGERPDTVNNFIANDYLPYHVLLDKDTSVATSYGVLGVPAYVLIDKKGQIVFQDNYFPRNEYKRMIGENKE